MDIRGLRLASQRLAFSDFGSAAEAVAHLGAVQAQDYLMAKWSLGLRVPGSTDRDIEAAVNDGSILRTHVMRPTWHFVPPADIRWMLALTSPRVHQLNATMYKRLELDEATLTRCHSVIERALAGGQSLTRPELGEHLVKIGIEAEGQRLTYVVMHAELEALICSGPSRGKQRTYALLAKRAPNAKALERDAALGELARRYFMSHGPAQAIDFAWWSGLTVKDAKAAVELAKAELAQETVDAKTYWLSPDAVVRKRRGAEAFLLSIYDEYTIAYRDRSALRPDRYAEKLLAMGNALTAVLLVNGRIEGTWKRTVGGKRVEIVISPLRGLAKTEQGAVQKASAKLGKFLGLEIRCEIREAE